MKIRTDSRPLFLQRFVMAFQRFCLFPLPKIPFRIKFIAICTRINRKRKSLAQRRKGAKLKAESKRYNVLIWAGLNYLTISIITIFSWIFQKYLGLVLTWTIKSLTELAECAEKSKKLSNLCERFLLRLTALHNTPHFAKVGLRQRSFHLIFEFF